MSICPRCAITFTCAMADQTGLPCWCNAPDQHPRLPVPTLACATSSAPPASTPDSGTASCFCPVCLGVYRDQQHPKK